jgi:asparagine synthase (glutamine-hydrolysing)
MCGIGGYWGSEITPEINEKVSIIQKAMHHRGPNDSGTVTLANTCLTHTRLSILDLTEKGRQPMWNSSKSTVLVLNGEIYNYKQLKKELQSYPYTSDTDTEVVLAAYDKWGIQFLEHIDGMFALCLYDQINDVKIIARDRFGKKPLYYVQEDNKYWFASEIRALIKANCIQAKLNKKVLGYYLQYQTVHYPQTIIDKILQLKPGSAIVTKGGESEHYYYAQEEADVQFDSNDNLASIFDESVEKRLMSDVPLALSLSGGIDSNLILASASKFQNINTFTIGFREKEFDESALAEKSSKHFGAKFHKVILEPTDFLNSLIPALSSMDHPSGDGPNTFTICKEIKKAGYTVALSGLGGDEVFLGYPHHKNYHKLRNNKAFKIAPKGMFAMANKLVKNRKLDKIYDLKTSINKPSSAMSSFRTNFNKKQLSELFDLNYQEYDSAGNKSKERAVSDTEMYHYMHDILLRDADQMSMANSVELRNPFLDRKLVSFVRKNNLQSLAHSKKALFESLGSRLPEYILNKKKTGFTFPWDSWMRNELFTFCQESMVELEEMNLFKQGSIMQLWNGFENGSKQFTWSRVWPLVCLSFWIKENKIEV